MITTVYVANDSVRVMSGRIANGKISISQCALMPLSEGAILNGVLLNAGQIQTVLSNIFDTYHLAKHGVRLVVDGQNVNTRILKLPLMQPKKLMPVIEGEFQDLLSDNSLIDYSIINPKNDEGNATILAVQTQRDFIQSYVNLFGEIKVELECIDIAANSVMKLMKHLKSNAGRTYALMVLDHNSLVQFLFVDNEFIMTRRSRILSDLGTTAFDDELFKNINTMIQFNKSQRTGRDITDIFLCGMPPAIQKKFPQYTDAFGVQVASFPQITNEITLPQGIDPTYWVYNLGCMYFTK